VLGTLDVERIAGQCLGDGGKRRARMGHSDRALEQRKPAAVHRCAQRREKENWGGAPPVHIGYRPWPIMRRQAGVVLPLFSIRTHRDWGIGQISDLPRCAAFIQRAGHRLLQVLPPHELSAGETSPYGALTAFGLDPIYVDLDAVEDLDPSAIDEALGSEGKRARDAARAAERVDYGTVRRLKAQVLHAGFERFYEREWSRRTPRADRLAAFVRGEGAWLDDLALYTAWREAHSGWGWSTWPEDERDRSVSAIQRIQVDAAKRLLEVAYVQWMLDEQWARARTQMRDLGVELMGDVPFVVGIESADVWSHASQFQLHVSLGAPPDDFSAEGQDWGLPAYDWLAMESDGLAWIRERTRRAARLYDRFRLDHVVGYFRQWVRSKQGNARGRFDPEGPDAQRARGLRVLGAMLAELPSGGDRPDPPRAIAEDLGVIPPFVREVLQQLGMPGYRVLPWERDGVRYRDPRAFPTASVVSWSTHDTAPIDQWWDEFSPTERADLAKRANVAVDAPADQRTLALLDDLYKSSSGLALVLGQELIGVRDRLNTPATVGAHNWSWRLPRPIEDLEADPRTQARLDAIRALVQSSGR
jgi:4-alpha-glucanotransferase